VGDTESYQSLFIQKIDIQLNIFASEAYFYGGFYSKSGHLKCINRDSKCT